MIPKKTYKIAVNFSKLLISYLAVGALLLLLIMLILNGKVPNFEMICSDLFNNFLRRFYGAWRSRLTFRSYVWLSVLQSRQTYCS